MTHIVFSARHHCTYDPTTQRDLPRHKKCCTSHRRPGTLPENGKMFWTYQKRHCIRRQSLHSVTNMKQKVNVVKQFLDGQNATMYIEKNVTDASVYRWSEWIACRGLRLRHIAFQKQGKLINLITSESRKTIQRLLRLLFFVVYMILPRFLAVVAYSLWFLELFIVFLLHDYVMSHLFNAAVTLVSSDDRRYNQR